MDNKKIAKELIKLAKEINSGVVLRLPKYHAEQLRNVLIDDGAISGDDGVEIRQGLTLMRDGQIIRD